MPRQQLADRLVDQRLERFLTRSVAANHLVLPRLNDAGILAPFAASEACQADASQRRGKEITSIHLWESFPFCGRARMVWPRQSLPLYIGPIRQYRSTSRGADDSGAKAVERGHLQVNAHQTARCQCQQPYKTCRAAA
jgi:hypothetical protein